MIAHNDSPRAVIYARYSPRPHESDSIQAQATDMLDWCEKNNTECHCVCYDPDVSGTVPFFARPGLACALSQLRRGDMLIIRSLSRAARSVAVGLAIEEEVERLGARLVVLESGGLQRTKAQDRNAWCMRVISYLMNDMQRMEINERTSRRMLQHQASGRAMGGSAPYGWRKDGHELIEDDQEQAVIARVVEWEKSGFTNAEIAARLTREGIKPRGDKWHINTVKRIIARTQSA